MTEGIDNLIIIDKFLADELDIHCERTWAWSTETDEEEVRKRVLQAAME